MKLLQNYPAYQKLTSKAKNRLRFCQISTLKELERYLNNPNSMKETSGVGIVTMQEFRNLYDAIKKNND